MRPARAAVVFLAFALVPLTLPCRAIAADARAASDRIIVAFREAPLVHAGRDGLARSAAPALDRLLQRYEVESLTPLAHPTRGARSALRDRLGRYHVLRARRPLDVEGALRELRALPMVESAERDFLVAQASSSLSRTIPDDPAFETRQWGFRNTGTQTLTPPSLPVVAGADIKAAEAWEVTTGSENVVVAILDTGLRFDHPEFEGRLWINPDEIPDNGIDDDENGFVDDLHGANFVFGTGTPVDDAGHGTACASVIGAAGGNGRQVAGLDWACRLMPIKVLGQDGFGYMSNIAAGIVYASDEGADIVSISLGGYGLSSALGDACEYAHGRGTLLVAAMMNDNDTFEAFPASFDEWVTAVGSTDPADDHCTPAVCGYGSNFGWHIDVVAPGVSIPILSYSDLGAVESGAGTSFATPMVAGLAALLLSRAPDLEPDQLRDVIRYSAVDGVGRPTEDLPGFDIYHGFGRIDCARALALAATARFPVIVAPDVARAAEGDRLAFEVSVSDADEASVDSLWLERNDLPVAATFTVAADRTRGLFTWDPGYRDAGTYPLRFGVMTPFRATAEMRVEILDVPDPPVVTSPQAVAGIEGSPLVVDISAADPDGDPLTSLEAASLPEGAGFTASSDWRSGQVVWIPGYMQAGTYLIDFRATSLDPAGPLGSPLIEWGTARTFVRIFEGPNQVPIVSAPSAVEGSEGEALNIPFTAVDPDGDELVGLEATPLPRGAVLRAEEGNSTGAIVWTPDYDQAGHYAVTLSASSAYRPTPVSEPEIQSGSTIISIAIADRERPDLLARAFPEISDRVLRLLASKPSACLRVQPVDAAYANEAVDVASFTLRAPGLGPEVAITPLPARNLVIGDRDRDGVGEIPLCFGKEDLRRLFETLPPGRRAVPVVLEAALLDGSRLRATFDWEVIAVGGPHAASVTPSPMRRAATLSFRTLRPGPLLVRLYDVSGRLVRIVADEGSRPAGYQDIPLDARDGAGAAMRSGVYFYRIDSSEGSTTGKIAVVR